MTQNSRIQFVDIEAQDDVVAEAMRYALRLVDTEIEVAWRSEDSDREEVLRRLLMVRFGRTVGRAIVIAGPDEEPWTAISSALCATTIDRRVLIAGTVVMVEPPIVEATTWLRERLDRRWPTAEVGSGFLAEDIESIWTALTALDFAPPRTKKFADDPFPAPPTLILGPTGTGKELLAKAIHAASKDPRPFGAVNCGGIESNLLDSELFGHEKGAFTGAVKEKTGLLEKYGVVLLDEIGDTPLSTQVKLLRFLNSGEIRPVGSNTVRKLKNGPPRIIAATHVDLDAKVAEGTFREDLLHRLRARTLSLAPLAKRRESINKLFMRFVSDAANALDIDAPEKLSVEAWNAVRTYPWAGNMREMKYAVECVLATAGRTIELRDLPTDIRTTYRRSFSQESRDMMTLVRRAADCANPQLTRIHAELLMRQRFEEHRKDPAAEHQRYALLANFVKQLGEQFGVTHQLEPLERAFRATEKAESFRTFRSNWDRLLVQTGQIFKFERPDVLKLCDDEFDALEKAALEERTLEMRGLESRAGYYAIPDILRWLAPFVEKFPLEDIKEILEAFSGILENEFVVEQLKRGMVFVRDVPLREAGRRLERWLEDFDLERLVIDAATATQPLDSASILNDPSLLFEFVAAQSNDDEAAKILELGSTKSLQRRLKDAARRLEEPYGEKRKQITEIRKARREHTKL